MWCGVVCCGAVRCGVVRRGVVSVQKNAIEAVRPLLQGSGSTAMRWGRRGTENSKKGAMSERSGATAVGLGKGGSWKSKKGGDVRGIDEMRRAIVTVEQHATVICKTLSQAGT